MRHVPAEDVEVPPTGDNFFVVKTEETKRARTRVLILEYSISMNRNSAIIILYTCTVSST